MPHLSRSVDNCGMNFEWGLFQFTMTDCKNLGNGLKTTPTLHTLRVTSSKMGEEEGRVLVKGLLQHPGLAVLGKLFSTCTLIKQQFSLLRFFRSVSK